MLAALLVVLLWIIRRHHSQVLLEEILPRQKLEKVEKEGVAAAVMRPVGINDIQVEQVLCKYNLHGKLV